jgi:hypothetical protein
LREEGKNIIKKVYSKLPNLDPTILTIVNTLFIIYVVILISLLIKKKKKEDFGIKIVYKRNYYKNVINK